MHTLNPNHNKCAWCGELLGTTLREFVKNRRSVISGEQAFCDSGELKAYQVGK